ncbi:MAG: hypothetical protein KC478_10190 [Bacteriovoracaceae bacterium]|nr:hypothetical protein [Bacteriovoracaceae bacterium]
MKKLLIGLTLLGSMSSFANDEISIVVPELNLNKKVHLLEYGTNNQIGADQTTYSAICAYEITKALIESETTIYFVEQFKDKTNPMARAGSVAGMAKYCTTEAKKVTEFDFQ